MLKVSAFYLEKQKSVIPKKKLSCCQYQNKKALFTDPIFSEGFELTVLIYILYMEVSIFSPSSWMAVYNLPVQQHTAKPACLLIDTPDSWLTSQFFRQCFTNMLCTLKSLHLHRLSHMNSWKKKSLCTWCTYYMSSCSLDV